MTSFDYDPSKSMPISHATPGLTPEDQEEIKQKDAIVELVRDVFLSRSTNYVRDIDREKVREIVEKLEKIKVKSKALGDQVEGLKINIKQYINTLGERGTKTIFGEAEVDKEIVNRLNFLIQVRQPTNAEKLVRKKEFIEKMECYTSLGIRECYMILERFPPGSYLITKDGFGYVLTYKNQENKPKGFYFTPSPDDYLVEKFNNLWFYGRNTLHSDIDDDNPLESLKPLLSEDEVLTNPITNIDKDVEGILNRYDCFEGASWEDLGKMITENQDKILITVGKTPDGEKVKTPDGEKVKTPGGKKVLFAYSDSGYKMAFLTGSETDDEIRKIFGGKEIANKLKPTAPPPPFPKARL